LKTNHLENNKLSTVTSQEESNIQSS
jgi:hypothetical protein